MHDSENLQHFCTILSLFRFFDYFPQGSYFFCLCVCVWGGGGGGDSAEWFIVQIFFYCLSALRMKILGD